MEIALTVTRADLWQLQEFYLNRRGSFRRNGLVFAGSVALTGVAFGLNAKLPWWGIVAIIVVAAGLGPPYAWFSRWYCKRQVMRLPFKSGSGGQSLRINAEGVFVKGAHSEGLSRWAAVTEIVETNEHIFILTGSLSGYVTPRRAFADSISVDAFFKLANSFWKGASAQA